MDDDFFGDVSTEQPNQPITVEVQNNEEDEFDFGRKDVFIQSQTIILQLPSQTIT
jgi:hypothetical protein